MERFPLSLAPRIPQPLVAVDLGCVPSAACQGVLEIVCKQTDEGSPTQSGTSGLRRHEDTRRSLAFPSPCDGRPGVRARYAF